MAQVETLEIAHNFQEDVVNQAAGRAPIDAKKLDQVLATIAENQNVINDNAKLIQRDDGQLKDGSVGVAQLQRSVMNVLKEINLRGAWVPTNIYYAKNDCVDFNGSLWICAKPHNSTTVFVESNWLRYGASGTDDVAIAAQQAQQAATSAATSLKSASSAATAAKNAQTATESSAKNAAASLDDVTLLAKQVSDNTGIASAAKTRSENAAMRAEAAANSGALTDPKPIASANYAILTGTYFTSGDTPTAAQYKVDVTVTDTAIIQSATAGDGRVYTRQFPVDAVVYPAWQDRKTNFIAKFNQLPMTATNGDTYVVTEEKRGGVFMFDHTMLGVNDGGININGWTRQVDNKVVQLNWWGVKSGDDIAVPLNKAIEYLQATGGTIVIDAGNFLCNTPVIINTNNIYIEGQGTATVLQRTSMESGYVLHWAHTANIKGGGLRNVYLKGRNDNIYGNGGVCFGRHVDEKWNEDRTVLISPEEVYTCDNWVCDTVYCDSFSQYGVGIYTGNNWSMRNVFVLNHGCVTHTDSNGILQARIDSVMGVFMFPRYASYNGKMQNIHSEISEGASNNTLLDKSGKKLNNAAMKLQMHRNLQATGIYCKGGMEQCLGIDSITGRISGVTVRAVSSSPGIVLGTFNYVINKPELRGGFILEDVDALDTGFSRSMVVGNGSETSSMPKLSDCTIKNVRTNNFAANSFSAIQNCIFRDIHCDSIFRLEVVINSGNPHPTLKNSGNTFENISGQTFEVRLSDSVINNCTARNGAFLIVGDNNTCTDSKSIKAVNGITLEGNDNMIIGFRAIKPTTRKAWFKAATKRNSVQGICYGSSAILDSSFTPPSEVTTNVTADYVDKALIA